MWAEVVVKEMNGLLVVFLSTREELSILKGIRFLKIREPWRRRLRNAAVQ